MKRINQTQAKDFLSEAMELIEQYDQWALVDTEVPDVYAYSCQHPTYGKITIRLEAATGQPIYSVFTKVQNPEAEGYVENMSKSGKWNAHCYEAKKALDFLDDALSWYEVPPKGLLTRAKPKITDVHEKILKVFSGTKDRKTWLEIKQSTQLNRADTLDALYHLETLGYLKSHKRNGDKIYRRL